MAITTFHSITLPGQDTAKIPDLANEFNSTNNYQIDDYCTYNGNLYRCTVEHNAQDWNAEHFSLTDVANEFHKKLYVPPISEPQNPKEGDLWIDLNEDSPVYMVDPFPSITSQNAVSSSGVKKVTNDLDNRKLNRSLITGDWGPTGIYDEGQLIFYNGYLWKRKIFTGTSDNVWTPEYWEDSPTNINTELNNLRNNEAKTAMIGNIFQQNKTYFPGDYVIHNDKLYECKNLIQSSQSWNDNDWIQIKIMDQINDLKNAPIKASAVFNEVEGNDIEFSDGLEDGIIQSFTINFDLDTEITNITLEKLDTISTDGLTYIETEYFDNNGNIAKSNATKRIEDYIQVNPEDNLILYFTDDSDNRTRIHEYDENHNWLRQIVNNTGNTFTWTASNDAAYIRFSLPINATNIKLIHEQKKIIIDLPFATKQGIIDIVNNQITIGTFVYPIPSFDININAGTNHFIVDNGICKIKYEADTKLFILNNTNNNSFLVNEGDQW